MSLKRVLIVNKMFPSAGLELLKRELETVVLPIMDYEADSLPTIKAKISAGFDGLVWNTKHRLTGEILDLAGPRLKAVTTNASGIDHIDTDELKKRNIPLGNTPNVLDNAVADIAVGLMIGAARRFKEGIKELEAGEWKSGVQWSLGQDIANSTVGIVGLGGIGQAVVRRLKGFDVAKFIYSGRTDKKEAKDLGVSRVSLQELLKASDFVILCCPLTNETKHIMNADNLSIMKKTSVLVNIGRGGLVDQAALYNALKSGEIFAAGLDVTTPEPLDKDDPIVSLPNCYIIPHLGSATVETRNAMAKISAENILLALKEKPMKCPISL
ncbi:glyoxylate reductase/hydroxypyruvate reductase-like [Nymphalis io]|uniref:glyoxylate reductase/hydroxypyruvate reductase-like n=1 Tax=Inachis io TaxID=171585 RepID=UPI002169EBAC|nr:glyoxylate reductase/hydroxypyruvate reductase-like [Nymphalis io]